ncbi:MAG: hypothetical protein JWN32_2604, partial [Solirubrobacterales bacterium]|nr:hypothetical protein [Solirubrobacterales bacterium]
AAGFFAAVPERDDPLDEDDVLRFGCGIVPP